MFYCHNLENRDDFSGGLLCVNKFMLKGYFENENISFGTERVIKINGRTLERKRIFVNEVINFDFN